MVIQVHGPRAIVNSQLHLGWVAKYSNGSVRQVAQTSCDRALFRLCTSECLSREQLHLQRYEDLVMNPREGRREAVPARRAAV